jgi:hypothetical protein
VVVFLTLYGDSRHPPKARQGFWRMLAWLVTRTPVSGTPFALFFSKKTENMSKNIKNCKNIPAQ